MAQDKLEFENWLSGSEHQEFSNYWNDESYEDLFDIRNRNLTKLEEYINNTGITGDIDRILDFLKIKGIKIKGEGLDIAAGVLWVTSYLLRKMKAIEKMSCLEFSKHRLLTLGPILLELHAVDKKRVKLILGDFYNIKIPKESLDFVVLSQALHHASNPNLLLNQVYQVLKKDGLVFIVGDLFINRLLYLKCYTNFLMSKFLKMVFPKNSSNEYIKKFSNKDFSKTFQELYFPPDSITGDHYYLRSQYHDLFLNNSFFYKEFKSTRKNHLTFLLSKVEIK